MLDDFILDPNFIDEIWKDSERVHARAKAENKTPVEIIDEELMVIERNIDKLMVKGIDEIKKRKHGEIFGFLPYFDDVLLVSGCIAKERLSICLAEHAA